MYCTLQFCGSGMIYSGSGSSFEFCEFRIQVKVPDPCGPGSMRIRTRIQPILLNMVSEPDPPEAGVIGWSRSRHFGPALAPAPP